MLLSFFEPHAACGNVQMSVQFGYLFMLSGWVWTGIFMGPPSKGIDKCWLAGWLCLPPPPPNCPDLSLSIGFARLPSPAQTSSRFRPRACHCSLGLWQKSCLLSWIWTTSRVQKLVIIIVV